jgi:hypothetical protein
VEREATGETDLGPSLLMGSNLDFSSLVIETVGLTTLVVTVGGTGNPVPGKTRKRGSVG